MRIFGILRRALPRIKQILLQRAEPLRLLVREKSATTHGIAIYKATIGSPGFVLLRRNTHRLEKGLIMRPRRDVFALDYIEETVKAYEAALKAAQNGKHGLPAEQLQWTHDVLAEYFAVTGSHPKIDPLRERFRRLPAPPRICDEPLIPYRRDLSQPPPVSYGALAALAHRRRSVRWFLPKPVPRELIDKALEVAAQSPSACNRQPFVFRIFDDPELVRQVASIPYGVIGYEHQIPVIVVIVGQLRNFFDARDRHLIYIDSALAAMSFILALETLGLSSCCINWPDIPEREKKMAELLKLEPDERPVMLIALGWPDPEGMVPRSVKKPLKLFRTYNFEQE
ncbi:Nitroreductase family protein [Thermogutta terrifontis]|uniref:Nitroreductase family protein n=2 Tax=Thermogutta terrifontis TaxID=1331910 RepID=A0A286RGA5_9BACT|nr:Nitroreductase family protein [Thermogutta terrifontis]